MGGSWPVQWGSAYFVSENAQLERGPPIPELSISTAFPVVPLLERNRSQVDSVREKNFQNGTGHVPPPCSPFPPSLYLFLYNSLDEGEWS